MSLSLGTVLGRSPLTLLSTRSDCMRLDLTQSHRCQILPDITCLQVASLLSGLCAGISLAAVKLHMATRETMSASTDAWVNFTGHCQDGCGLLASREMSTEARHPWRSEGCP